MLALIGKMDAMAQAAGGWNLVLATLASQVVNGTASFLSFVATVSRQIAQG